MNPFVTRLLSWPPGYDHHEGKVSNLCHVFDPLDLRREHLLAVLAVEDVLAGVLHLEQT